MAFKGAIRSGTTVEAKLLLDHTASGPAFLLMGYGRLTGSPSDKDDTTAPGGVARTQQSLDGKGRLEVGVDMSGNSDTGVLLVNVDGKEKTRENIAGDTIWVYAVLDAAPAAGGAPV
jgi:hypothetical protein